MCHDGEKQLKELGVLGGENGDHVGPGDNLQTLDNGEQRPCCSVLWKTDL